MRSLAADFGSAVSCDSGNRKPPGGEPTEGIVTFWVLQSRTHQKMVAKEAIVPKDVAEIVAGLIASEGAKWFLKAGIASDEKELNLAQLDKETWVGLEDVVDIAEMQ